MGARQSKRSVDITTTPKKDGVPSEGSVAGDAAAPGDGKLERIEETDGKPTTNGTAPHTDSVSDEKDKDKDQEKGKDKEKDEDTGKDDNKLEDTRQESETDATVLAEEATTPTTDATPAPTSPDSATSPESKDTKKKEKKKWSFRSLSFGKRDRSKTAREGTPKNGDVAKAEPLAEGGEETEAAAPVEETTGDKKAEDAVVSSPTEESTPAAVAEAVASPPATATATEAAPTATPDAALASLKEEEKAPVESSSVTASSIVTVVTTTVTKTLDETVENKEEEEKEEPATPPALTPVTPAVVEENKEEPEVVEKVDTTPVAPVAPAGGADAAAAAADAAVAVVADNVEVSQSQAVVISSSSTSSLENRVTVEAVVGQNQAQAQKENRDIVAAEKSSSSSSSSSSASVIERKTTEEIPPPLPSSPPPTPIDPSPLERAQHAAASPSALAEALKAPAEAANNVILLASNLVVPSAVASSTSDDQTPEEKERAEQRSSSPHHPPHPPPPSSSDNSFSREGEEQAKEVENPDERKEETTKPNTTEDHSNENFIDREREIEENDNEAQASVIVNTSDESTAHLPVDEESLVVVEAKPALVITEEPSQPNNSEKLVEDEDEIVPPPLPESPIPSFEKSLIQQETDSETVFDPIEELRASHMATEGMLAAFKETVPAAPVSIVDDNVQTNFDNPAPISHKESNVTEKDEELISVCPLAATRDLDSDPQNLKTDPEVCSLIVKPVADSEIIVTNGGGASESYPASEPPSKVDTIIADSQMDFQEIVYETKQKTIVNDDIQQQEIIDSNKSNEEFEVESLTISLNSYNDSESKFHQRLNESNETNGDDENVLPNSHLDFSTPSTTDPSTNDLLPDNDLQKIVEVEAPVENVTEELTKAPASPAPPAPIEIPVVPHSEPVITEDVASVTKAIEEIDISDKAVAAAVNEAIESVNANDIVNDMHHQKIINE